MHHTSLANTPGYQTLARCITQGLCTLRITSYSGSQIGMAGANGPLESGNWPGNSAHLARQVFARGPPKERGVVVGFFRSWIRGRCGRRGRWAATARRGSGWWSPVASPGPRQFVKRPWQIKRIVRCCGDHTCPLAFCLLASHGETCSGHLVPRRLATTKATDHDHSPADQTVNAGIKIHPSKILACV